MSTNDALFNVTRFLYDGMDKKDKVIAIFLDIQKAFDTVDHNLLLEKLEYIGIRRISLKLFKSYLTNRTQTVRIGNVYSDVTKTLCGIPQGIVLGPILFNIFVNGLLNMSEMPGKIISFADGTVIMIESKMKITCMKNPINVLILLNYGLIIIY